MIPNKSHRTKNIFMKMFGNVEKIPYALIRLSVCRKNKKQFGNIRKKVYAPMNETFIEKRKNNLQDPKRKHITHVARTVINTWAHVQVFISARMMHAPVSICTQSSKCIRQQFGFVLSFKYDGATMHMHLRFFRCFGVGVRGVVFFRRRRASWYIITFPTHTNFLSHQHLIPDILSPIPYSHIFSHSIFHSFSHTIAQPNDIPIYHPIQRYGGYFSEGGGIFVRTGITFSKFCTCQYYILTLNSPFPGIYTLSVVRTPKIDH